MPASFEQTSFSVNANDCRSYANAKFGVYVRTGLG